MMIKQHKNAQQRGKQKTWWRKKWSLITLPPSACPCTPPCIVTLQPYFNLASHTYRAHFSFSSTGSKWHKIFVS